MEVTESMIRRAKAEFERHSIEPVPVDVKYIKGTIYAYGSELACLRLLRAYRLNPKARIDPSSDGRWYFSLETDF